MTETNERLECISKSGYSLGNCGQMNSDLSPDDVNWLIEEAEQTQSLLKENARLCAALEFYADEKNNTDKYSNVMIDSGKLARKALKDNPYEH